MKQKRMNLELCDFVLALLSFPHANADYERIFSSINGLKTKIRCKLITDTLSGVLHTKQNITSGRESKQNCTKHTNTFFISSSYNCFWVVPTNPIVA